jgi:hypothetical protein
MKVLYINRNKFDYLQDLVYTGMVKMLGPSSVIELPWNDKFHINFKNYPKNIGLYKGALLTSIFNRFSAKEFSMVIVASCHPDTLKTYLDIVSDLPSSVVTVFLDGGDWPEVAGDLDRLGGKDLYEEILSIRPFDHIFKREYLIDHSYDDNVHPLPFAFNFDRLPKISGEKKYDVAFWAVESDPIRTAALDMIQDRFDCKDNGSVKNQVMKKYKRKGSFYLQELARCKVSLNFRGAGWDTLRYWEVPALAGFMISQKPGILIENNFVDNKEIIFCNEDLSDLLELCQYYLKNEEKREEIGKRALAKMKDHHTDINRAKEILTTCGLS